MPPRPPTRLNQKPVADATSDPRSSREQNPAWTRPQISQNRSLAAHFLPGPRRTREPLSDPNPLPLLISAGPERMCPYGALSIGFRTLKCLIRNDRADNAALSKFLPQSLLTVMEPLGQADTLESERFRGQEPSDQLRKERTPKPNQPTSFLPPGVCSLLNTSTSHEHHNNMQHRFREHAEPNHIERPVCLTADGSFSFLCSTDGPSPHSRRVFFISLLN